MNLRIDKKQDFKDPENKIDNSDAVTINKLNEELKKDEKEENRENSEEVISNVIFLEFKCNC
jgi:hypothetical protein